MLSAAVVFRKRNVRMLREIPGEISLCKHDVVAVYHKTIDQSTKCVIAATCNSRAADHCFPPPWPWPFSNMQFCLTCISVNMRAAFDIPYCQSTWMSVLKINMGMGIAVIPRLPR